LDIGSNRAVFYTYLERLWYNFYALAKQIYFKTLKIPTMCSWIGIATTRNAAVLV